MPRKGYTAEFYNGKNQFKVPFMMYADFEAILESLQRPSSTNPNQSRSEGATLRAYTKEVNQHIPSGFCVFSKFAYGEVQNPLKLYRSKDCIGKFCDYIRQEAHRLYQMFPETPMDPLTQDQWTRHKEATKCHICCKPFDSKYINVRDHCHYTGCYRRPAHRNCNLRY